MPSPYSDDLYSSYAAEAEAEAEAGSSTNANTYAVSDNNDLDEALSPSDGYFRASSSSDAAPSPHPSHSAHPNVPFVPNVMVEDPSLRQARDGEAKAREAAEERRLSINTKNGEHRSRFYEAEDTVPSPQTPSVRYPNLSQQLHRRSLEDDAPVTAPSDHHRPIHHGGLSAESVNAGPSSNRFHSDAPPAYSPRSPTSPSSASPLVSRTSTGYQTFSPPAPTPSSTMGVPEEQQALLPREPESMGSPSSGKPPFRWQRVKNAFHSRGWRKMLKNVLFGLILISIFAIVLSSFTLRPTDEHKDPSKNKPGDDGNGDFIQDPGAGPGDFVWKNLGICLNEPLRAPSSSITDIEFRAGKNLTLIQSVDDGSGPGRQPHVTGEVVFRPVGPSGSPKIEIELFTNDRDLKVSFEYSKERQTYEVITPRKFRWTKSGAPCIQMRITVWVPSDGELDDLEILVVSLDLLIEKGLNLGGIRAASFTTLSGDIFTPTLQDDDTAFPYKIESREIYVNTLSGIVKGWYPLYDLLKVSTASGDVKIDVQTMAISEHAPKPATLGVYTASGELRVFEPVSEALKLPNPGKKFPPRDYVTEMTTVSGDITCEVAFSSSATFKTKSGDMKLHLWPVLDASNMLRKSLKYPQLTTTTTSGDTELELLSPSWTALSWGEHGPIDPPERPHEPWIPIDDDEDFDLPPIGDHDPVIIINPHAGHRIPDVALPMMPPTPPSPPSPPSPPPQHDTEPSDGSYDDPVLSLISNHNSISGNIKLHYPGQWEGSLKAQTISGLQNFRGKGLSTWHAGASPVRLIEGEKGSEGKSKMAVTSVSGDEDFFVGGEESAIPVHED